jgi:hypothetical protein
VETIERSDLYILKFQSYVIDLTANKEDETRSISDYLWKLLLVFTKAIVQINIESLDYISLGDVEDRTPVENGFALVNRWCKFAC